MAMYPSSETQEDEENPLLALLDADDEDTSTISFVPTIDDEDDKKTQKREPVVDNELSERLSRLERENEQLKTKIATAPTYQNSAPVYTPQNIQMSSGLFPSSSGQDAAQAEINRLNEAFAQNPGAALREVYLRGQQAAEEAQKRSLIPVAIQNTRFAINQFVSSSGMDAETKSEFNRLMGEFTPEQLAQADPTKIEAQLELVRKIAKANVIEEKEKANRRAQNPPPFAAGGHSSGKGTPVTVKLSKQQKAAWELGKSQGLTEKDLYEMYKNGELD